MKGNLVHIVYDTNYYRGVLIENERVDTPIIVTKARLKRIVRKMNQMNIKFDVIIIDKYDT